MRIVARLAALESQMPPRLLACTLSAESQPIEEVEANYIAQYGFNPEREWLHIRLVDVEPQRGL